MWNIQLFLQKAAFVLLHPELELRVREHQLTSFKDILRIADMLADARAACHKPRFPREQQKTEDVKQGDGEHIPDTEVKSTSNNDKIQCFDCKDYGHVRSSCSKRSVSQKNLCMIAERGSQASLRLCKTEAERAFEPV